MANNNKRTRFTGAEKNTLMAGQEITDGQIVWRKLQDGSGAWRYDFRVNGRRFKGTEPPRISRRPVGLSEAAIADS